MSQLKLNETAQKIINFDKPYNYKDWLLRPNTPQVLSETKCNLEKTDSFEILVDNQGSVLKVPCIDVFVFNQLNCLFCPCLDFDVITDFENDETNIDLKHWLLPNASSENQICLNEKSHPTNTTAKNGSSFFGDIYSKPIECWLLPRKQ